MIYLITHNPFPYVVAVLLGLATAWWIWGRMTPAADARRTQSSGSDRETAQTAKPAPNPTPASTPATAPKSDLAPKAEAKPGAAASGAATATASGAAAVAGASAASAKTPEKAKDKVAANQPKAESKPKTAKKTAEAKKPKATDKAKETDKPKEAKASTDAKQSKPDKKPKIAAAVGKPEDLTRIKGVGPKLKDLCYSLGVKRFDQIAAWKASDIAEVDGHMSTFKGRIKRDKWVAQAKLLAAGKDAEHVKQFGK